MQRIATVIGSGKEVSWDSGRLLLDGRPIPLEKLLEYDGLGALEWASEATRQWAASLGAAELSLARGSASPDGQVLTAPAPSVDSWTSGAPFQPETAPAPVAKRKPAKPAAVLAEALIELAVVAGLALYLPDIPAKWLVTGIGAAYLLLIVLSAIPLMSASRPARIGLGVATGVLGVASLIVLLPTAVQVGIWAGRALPVRAAGQLPAVERMLGAGQSDARRMLDYPQDWRKNEGETNAYDFTLPDIPSAEASSPTSGRISLNASGEVEAVSFQLTIESGQYADLTELLSARLGYKGRLTGTVSRTDAELSGACRMVDASPTCSVQFVCPVATAGSAASIHLAFRRSFDGDSGAELSAADLAFSGEKITGTGSTDSEAHKSETMYALIAESVSSRTEAETRLLELERIGQSLPWVVETSDHFTGMRPGWQVVMVAFRYEGVAQSASQDLNEEGLQAYVKTVVKNCDDPITVDESQLDW